MKKKWLVCMLLVIGSLYGTGCGSETVNFGTENIMRTEEDVVSQMEQEAQDRDDIGSGIQTSSQSTVVYVFVCGAVISEGVYELASESRIQDALFAAGGFLPEADTDAVNLADIVYDGQKIYFPFEGEQLEDISDISKAEDSNGKVNINTATKEQLIELPGIGNSKAENIIRYREEHGNFQDIQEIKDVNGIGDGIFLQIEAYITI